MGLRTPILGLDLVLLQSALEVMPDAALGVDDNGIVLLANKRACDMLQYSFDALKGTSLGTMMPDVQDWTSAGQFLSMVRFGELDVQDARLLTKSGEKTVWTACNLVQYSAGSRYCVLISLRDVTDRSQLEERLRTLSLTDELTGLHNRRYLRSVLPFDEERSRRFGQLLACTFVDIDRFKEVNDLLGHSVGDEAIKTVAALLKSNARKLDTVCRWGGDEFVIVSLVKTAAGLRVMLERLLEKTSAEPVNACGHRFHLTITCGAAYGNCQEGVTSFALLEKADELLLRGKKEGRNRFAMAEVLGS